MEMGSKDWEEIIVRLSKDVVLTAQAAAVYPDGWTGENITDAIAEYEKTLITPDSLFDKWLCGDNGAITAEDAEDYRLFNLYRCASCHMGRSVGGQSFEYMDFKADYFADRGEPLNSDKGLMSFTGKEDALHRFKGPDLRNVELSHPCMHDGTVATLDESVTIMGRYLSGMPVSDNDRRLIVTFLRILTGKFRGRSLSGTPVER